MKLDLRKLSVPIQPEKIIQAFQFNYYGRGAFEVSSVIRMTEMRAVCSQGSVWRFAESSEPSPAQDGPYYEYTPAHWQRII